MSIVQTTLIFVAIPAVATLLVAVMVYARSAERTPRYRPGGPWPYEPVWYLPHPEHSGPVSSMGSHDRGHAELNPAGHHNSGQLTAGQPTPGHLTAGQLTAGHPAVGVHGDGLHRPGGAPTITGRAAEPATASGGASGEW
ncbi:MAG TPA: hypothetical protein VF557_09610 [Jatrophihabitans sp.]|jgi:hypothetical protein|uniref:aa3-type cytochrome oxidase subunit CtaJ n=1 Tax=Jatrophihabitans sp. TaxID=1932789 RepID=UPI002F0DA780